MPDARTADKSPDAFRTISEVADELGLPQHVLRFWETKFNQIRPVKRAGGRRFYRPDDIVLLRGIQHLLYGEGYTIKGVQKILKDQGIRHVQGIGIEADGAPIHSSEPEERAPRKPRGGMVGGLLGLIPGRKAPPPAEYDPLEEPPLPFMEDGLRAAPRFEPGLDAPRGRGAEPYAPSPAQAARFEDEDGDDTYYRAHEAYEEPTPAARPAGGTGGGASGHAPPRTAPVTHAPPRVEPRFEADPPEQFRFARPEEAEAYDDRHPEQADDGYVYDEPAFTPLPPPPAPVAPAREASSAPMPPRRPSRGPAARTPEPPPVPELEDPLLPFFDDDTLEPPAQQISEPLDARIRRMKEREEPVFTPHPPSPPSASAPRPAEPQARDPRAAEPWTSADSPRTLHRGPLRAPPEEIFDDSGSDFEARDAFAPDGTRVPRPEPRRGPPEQYLPPHLRSDPRLAAPGAVPVLSREDVTRLQGALHELGECRRLLEQVLGPEAGRRS